jgi:hypothetical protein
MKYWIRDYVEAVLYGEYTFLNKTFSHVQIFLPIQVS